ncbi:MAG TPA: lysylphosphatidylglycerol synthase domain-containing protein [Stellaceae bacterium]|nr:lysylphosphatidylglycerol synthase domain-containing protein [Stellaceae bacterium]
MSTRRRRFTGLAAGIVLFAGALVLLDRSLHGVRLDQLWHELRQFPASSIALAVLLTIISHSALTAYDAIGVYYIRRHLAYWRIALAAFLAYSISHSLGFAAVTGGAVRYRLYSRWGISAVEVAQIMGMGGVTLFLGMFSIGGIALLFDAGRVQGWLDLPLGLCSALGILCLAVVAGYGMIGLIRQKPIRVGSFELAIPSPRFAAFQIVISAVDWLLVASVLYVLLPSSPTFGFPNFLGVFVLAYLLGILSNVPGGLGVFESIILFTMTPAVPAPAVLSALLVYRGVYHLLPLSVGGVTFIATELWRRRKPSAKPAGRRIKRHVDG